MDLLIAACLMLMVVFVVIRAIVNEIRLRLGMPPLPPLPDNRPSARDMAYWAAVDELEYWTDEEWGGVPYDHR